MLLQSKYWPGIIPVLLILFFPLKHLQDQMNIPLLRTYFSIAYICLIILIVIGSSIKRKYILELIPNLNLFYIYIFLQSAILLFISYFSSNLLFTSFHATYSIFTLGMIFTSFYFVQYFYIKNIKWQLFFEISSLIFLIYIILGQLFIQEWIWGDGLRLSGGVNPNRMAFLTLYFLFQTHINALLINKWTRLKKVIWLLSLIIIIWTFSRTVMLTVLTVYYIYLSYYIITKFRSVSKKGINFRKTIIFTLKILCYASVFGVLFKVIFNNDIYLNVVDRILNVENMYSRTDAWNVIMESFSNNPLFGTYGWWGSKNALISLSHIPDSSHNFFVRVLSEVGIIGLISIVIMPIIIMCLLLLNNTRITFVFQNAIGIYLFAIIISIFFVAQFFEDRYLTMEFATTSDVIIWFLSFSLIIYHFSLKKIK